MSRRSSHEHVQLADSGEVLEVIREEQGSPTLLSADINDDKEDVNSLHSSNCPCQAIIDEEAEKRHAEEKERLLEEKELEMEAKFKERLEAETQYLKDRFGFILQNEQIRASYMLREAHRERQEKISALQTQLECKNLAGLMYVLCSERKKSKMEMLRITEEYTNYIHVLQDILEESQTLILNLSRGYKTAARVDGEWKAKMKKIMEHFQSFVYEFVGGSPDTNQYFFDIPALLKTKASIKDNPQEDPCEDEEEFEEFFQPKKSWYETLEGDDRPFVMFGDMAELKPSQRGEVLRSIKAAKTAPRKWKEYVFHDMFLKQNCPNADSIKDEYASECRWEITTDVKERQTSSRCSVSQSRRGTTASMDIKGNMGSILKIITSTGAQNTNKTALLGARDSMEIASTTRLREKHRPSTDHPKVVLNIGNKIDAMFDEMQAEDDQYIPPDPETNEPPKQMLEDDKDVRLSESNLRTVINDSLHVIQTHVPDHDSKINYEKICPMEKCQRMQVDSFIRSLPAYMRASPFTHIEQTYDNYEACSPEQIEILRRRIEEKKKKEKVDFLVEEDPLRSWSASVDGVGVATVSDVGGINYGMGGALVQTSQVSLMPPCTCPAPRPSPASSTMKVYNVADLIPIKLKLDEIKTEHFFHDHRIEFNRFQVLGQSESDDLKYEREKDDSSKNRLQDLKKILKQHPSLCEIFQANTRC